MNDDIDDMVDMRDAYIEQLGDASLDDKFADDCGKVTADMGALEMYIIIAADAGDVAVAFGGDVRQALAAFDQTRAQLAAILAQIEQRKERLQ